MSDFTRLKSSLNPKAPQAPWDWFIKMILVKANVNEMGTNENIPCFLQSDNAFYFTERCICD